MEYVLQHLSKELVKISGYRPAMHDSGMSQCIAQMISSIVTDYDISTKLFCSTKLEEHIEDVKTVNNFLYEAVTGMDVPDEKAKSITNNILTRSGLHEDAIGRDIQCFTYELHVSGNIITLILVDIIVSPKRYDGKRKANITIYSCSIDYHGDELIHEQPQSEANSD